VVAGARVGFGIRWAGAFRWAHRCACLPTNRHLASRAIAALSKQANAGRENQLSHRFTRVRAMRLSCMLGRATEKGGGPGLRDRVGVVSASK
jgi:hypothetical protein